MKQMEEKQYEFLQMLETFIGADNNARSIAERIHEALKKRHDSPLPLLLLSVILHISSCFCSYYTFGSWEIQRTIPGSVSRSRSRCVGSDECSILSHVGLGMGYHT